MLSNTRVMGGWSSSSADPANATQSATRMTTPVGVMCRVMGALGVGRGGHEGRTMSGARSSVVDMRSWVDLC
jgi:hypothetical protein